MSATGRGAERRDADYYPTPAGPILRLLDHVELPGGEWLEPSAGEGHIIRTVNAQRGDVRWTACELRQECGAPLRSMGLKPRFGDFLQIDPLNVWTDRWHAGPFGVALGNPPFGLAQEFVEHTLRMADQVVFLLRLSFLESQKREAFFQRVGVPDVFVLPERPSFTGEGTDSCAYAWMRWMRGGAQEGRVRILYDKRQLSLLGGA